MYSQPIVLRTHPSRRGCGVLTEDGWKVFLSECVKAMGMTPIAPAAVWRYPVEGKGGVGWTMFQPIVESFLALDIWSDHRGAYLFIASCRKFDALQLVAVIRSFGMSMDDSGAPVTLRLK
jgi:hypothetical protein